MGPRFLKAVELANELHDGQPRKGTAIPYIAHLLAVTALVLEHGGTEDQAIAALLHDAVEDSGGAPTLARIRASFGDYVADIVSACSDTDQKPKPPWKERKERYIASLSHHGPDVLLVSLADKVHNARAILADYRLHGESLWGRFKAGKSEQLWYYRALCEAFKGSNQQLWTQLNDAVTAIEQHAATAVKA